MSPFGLFDLLKTLLPAPDQTAAHPSSSPANLPAERAPAPPPTATENPSSSSQLPPAEQTSQNACADFLFRHEQRAQELKGKKKRP